MATPGKELPSLLFTPRGGADDRAARAPFESRSPFAQQRSPGNATPASAGIFRSISQKGDVRAGSTPARRSLTPGTPRDTPPPPPSHSLYDGGDGTEAGMNYLWGAGNAAATPSTAAKRSEHPPGAGVNEDGDTWVTVYGFTEFQIPLVLQEFQKCGDVVRFDSFAQGLSVNWIHIQYQTVHSAKRALMKDGEQLDKTLLIGVKPLSGRQRQVLEEEQPALLTAHPKQLPSVMVPVRSHRVGGVASAPVPRPDISMWTRVNEILFGA